jgi:hypothetical protein
MLLVREIMYCKPGKVGELVKRFKQMEPLMKEMGQTAAPRMMTDVCADQFWMLVWEQETPSLEKYMEDMQKGSSDPRMRKIMEGYHDLVVSGKREIYKIE